MAKFLSAAGRAGLAKVLDPMGVRLLRMGVSANAVTMVGTAGVLAAAIFLVPRGEVFWGMVVITVSVCTDLVDGAIARAAGKPSKFGALLDSTMDRIADGAIFGSLAYWLAITGQHVAAIAALTCLVTAEVVSYAKARAESLGASCDVGIAERLERLILVGVAAILTLIGVPHAMPVVLWLLAVLSAVTIFQRLWHVRRQLNGDDA